jgi:hypothetical protein
VFWWGNLKQRYYVEDQGLDGRIILKLDLKEMGRKGMNCINVAYYGDKWDVLVNAALNLRIP